MNLYPTDRCGIISGERTAGGLFNREKCTLANFLRGGKCALWKNWISANGTLGDIRQRGKKHDHYKGDLRLVNIVPRIIDGVQRIYLRVVLSSSGTVYGVSSPRL